MSQQDLSGGQGKLLKTTIKAGDGAQPLKGQKVWCHYTGKLQNGAVFDSSRPKPHRRKGFDFTVGAGQVIQAWDKGLLTMKVGEVCELTCHPDYGYGPEGTPGGPIPPNATLIFEIELLHIGDDPRADLPENAPRG